VFGFPSECGNPAYKIQGLIGKFYMIEFEEELKKFYPSMEVGQLEETVNGADLTDAVDLYVKMGKENVQNMQQQVQPVRDMRPGRRY